MKIKKIWHPWTVWECYPAGFHSTVPPEGMNKLECQQAYAEFLSDLKKFRKGMEQVAKKWPRSCEHFLTNEQMNRIAWLGQSAMCISTGISSAFCGGFKLLSPQKQKAANKEAAKFLTRWLDERKNKTIHRTLDEQGLPTGHSGRGTKRIDGFESGTILQSDLFLHPEE